MLLATPFFPLTSHDRPPAPLLSVSRKKTADEESAHMSKDGTEGGAIKTMTQDGSCAVHSALSDLPEE